MNILFVNYGNFTTNSLNHISGFANWLCDHGNACIVAVPGEKETLSAVPDPRFSAATYAEVLARPAQFPDGRPADLLHAWTPREGVRKFVVAYQRLLPGTRLLVHLEDNEEYLLEVFGGKPVTELRELTEQQFPFPMVDGLPHPVRYHHLLRLADGVTVIQERLREFVPPDVPVHLLWPGVDFSIYHSQPVASGLRRELGLRADEKVVVFTGSVTFANASEMRDLYGAIRLLNESGTPTRLVRTGFTLPQFVRELGFDCSPWVVELGFVDKTRLPGLLALADVLVQPGRAGAFNDFRLPSKLPEYLSVGKPVVLPATNIGHQLTDGQEALILRRGDAAEIAALCAQIFSDPSLATNLGRAAGKFARQYFDLPTNADGLLKFYRQCVGGPPNPSWAALRETEETELPALLSAVAQRLRANPLTDPVQQHEVLAHLDDLARASRQLDANLQERAGTVKDLRIHSDGLERTRALLTKDIAAVRAHAAEHAQQLEREVQRIHRLATDSLQKARKICEQAEREVTRLQDELYESEYRVQRLQAAFSWRATAWLRALRRKFRDPYFGPPAQPPLPPLPTRTIRLAESDFSLLPPAPRLYSHLDAPRRWPAEATDLIVRGWVVSEAGPLRGVRARIGTRLYPGESGLIRPDVGLNFKQFSGATHSGFRMTIAIEKSDAKLELEAEDAAGGWHVFYLHPLGQDQPLTVRGTYTDWVQRFDTTTPSLMAHLRSRAEKLLHPPMLSVLMPVYNTAERWLTSAIESVRAQAYPHWELCIADDASSTPHLRPLLEHYARLDRRIKVSFRANNGHISAASNTALELATGVFCVLLDHDDELAPHALLCVAEALNAHPDTEVIYSDEDKIDESGNRFDPHFKPDWNPDLLVGQNYLSHLTAYRTTRLTAVGGFRPGFEGAQDWDLALRVTEQVSPGQVKHIPRVLYHWRAVEGSTAMQLQEKDYAVQAARRALEEHFSRRQEAVQLHLVSGRHWRCQRARPSPAPLVTLIIPTRNRRELLEICVASILAQTAYPNFEILIADNDSDDPELFAFYERMKAQGRFEVLACPGSFNYSAINNHAVQSARGFLVCLLNNDLETMHPEWLDEMVSHAVRPEIGCVGAKLYYPDLRIQHAGVITGLGGVAGHAFKSFTREEPGTPQFRPHLVQNISAVTAACLVIRKSVYLEVGGFDEAGLAVAFNDVDFCLKIEQLGLRNLFTPFAELLHHESASRGAEDSPEKVRRFQAEIEAMRARWGERLLADPAYNPNLTLDSEDFGLAYPPRVPRLDQVASSGP